MSHHNHAALHRALATVEARLKALDAPAPDPHGDDADQRAARQNVEDVVTERARLEVHLRLVLCALTKIERGIYGSCEDCKGLIGAKRLDAMPWATLCLSCKTAEEIRAEQFKQATQRRAPEPVEDDDEGAA